MKFVLIFVYIYWVSELHALFLQSLFLSFFFFLFGSISLVNITYQFVGFTFSSSLFFYGCVYSHDLGLNPPFKWTYTGVYADDNDVKKLLGDKYERLSSSELVENKEFNDDLLESDISMTVRLQIVYSKLSIRSVRSAFEESVGGRLKKFGGSNNGELLQR